MTTAETDIRASRYNAEGGFHASAVFLAEQAAQCTLKALLRGVGAAEAARGHGLLALLDGCASRAGLELEHTDREDAAALAREYMASRYPDALPEGTPWGHYGPRTAAWAAAVADALFADVAQCWARLRSAE